jgi:carbon monoxide dehydrogenase subunit G
MGVSKYISKVKTINHTHDTIYNFLSNFNNLGKFINDFTLEQISSQLPDGSIDSFESDYDSCRFHISSLGEAGFRIIEREPTKTIKITGEGKIPFQLHLWIQIAQTGPYESKIRLTLHADMGFMIKAIIGNKLKEGIDRMADALAMIPYNQVGNQDYLLN